MQVSGVEARKGVERGMGACCIITLTSMETPRADDLCPLPWGDFNEKIYPKDLGNPWLQLWLERMKNGRRSLLEVWKHRTGPDRQQTAQPAPNKRKRTLQASPVSSN